MKRDDRNDAGNARLPETACIYMAEGRSVQLLIIEIISEVPGTSLDELIFGWEKD